MPILRTTATSLTRNTVGWNEWCALPGLSIPAIKAKLDTGAKTSAIHAFNIHTVVKNREKIVHFDVHPIQGNNNIVIHCEAPVIDRRAIMSSNGQKEYRYVIETILRLGGSQWNFQLTLSNRDPLRYRMLLGRGALRHRVLIDPSGTCRLGKHSSKILASLYGITQTHSP